MDFENQIEKILKDIQDTEDREMAYELVKILSPLFTANGVAVKATKYNLCDQVEVKESCSVDKFNKELVMHYGISIDGLDFTEHDKVFEDKISKLEKQIERLMREKQFAYDRSEQLMKTADIQNSANEELKQRIAELDSKNNQITESILRKETKIHELESEETSELPFDPLECANYLINATYKDDEIPFLERKVCRNIYDIDDLEQIAEHLLVYCKHNRESE